MQIQKKDRYATLQKYKKKNEEIGTFFQDCTNRVMRVILDVVKAVKNNRCQPWAAHGPQRNAQDLGKTPSVPIFPTF